MVVVTPTVFVSGNAIGDTTIHDVNYNPVNPYYDENIQVTTIVSSSQDIIVVYVNVEKNGGQERLYKLHFIGGLAYSGTIPSTLYKAGDSLLLRIHVITYLEHHYSGYTSMIVLGDEYYDSPPEDPVDVEDPVYTGDWEGPYDNSPPGLVNGAPVVPLNAMVLLVFAGLTLLSVMIIVRRKKN